MMGVKQVLTGQRKRQVIGRIPGEPSAKLCVGGDITVVKTSNGAQVDVELHGAAEVHARAERELVSRVDPVLPLAQLRQGRTWFEMEMFGQESRSRG